MAEAKVHVAQNGGVIVNLSEIQSLEIEGPFSYENTNPNWLITMQATGKIVLNFRSNVRRLEFTLLAGDQLLRNAEDLLIARTHVADDYRAMRPGGSFTSTQRSGSSLARRTTRQMGSPLAADVEEIVQASETRGSG